MVSLSQGPVDSSISGKKPSQSQGPFDHPEIPDSALSKDTFSCKRFLLYFLLTLYTCSIASLQYFYLYKFDKKLYLWLSFILYTPAINLMAIELVGRHILAAIMYPY